VPLAPYPACLPRGGAPARWAGDEDDAQPAGPTWRLDAACRDLPTDLFFPVGHGPHAQAQVRLAKEICSGCHVRRECLAYALAANAGYGVFGGLGEDERREFRRRGGTVFGLAGGELEESA